MESEVRSAMNALSAFLLGVGVFVLILGPCADLYSIGMGLIGLVASWVMALTIRVFFFGGPRDERYSRYY